jgi:hypothetical protein
MANSPVVIRRPRQSPGSELERTLIRLLTGLDYGRISLVIQDGVVIQINREESVKLSPDSP